MKHFKSRLGLACLAGLLVSPKCLADGPAAPARPAKGKAGARAVARSPQPGPAPMTIMVDNSFPEGLRLALTTAAGDTLEAVQRRIPGTPPAGARPILCIHNDGFPEVAPTGDWTPYLIKVDVDSATYDRFVYQLAHELGHVMLDPRRTNGLAETFAFAVSYQALDDMAARWAVDPPFEALRSYAPNFTAFRVGDEQSYLQTFPREVQSAVAGKRWKPVSLYLRLRRQDQDDRSTARNLNSLGAIMLRAQKVHWADLRGLASHTAPSPTQSPRFSTSLPIDISALPASLRSTLQFLGRGNTSAMAAVYFPAKPEVPAVRGAFLFQAQEGWVWLFECAGGERPKYDAMIRGLHPARYSWDAGGKTSTFSPGGLPLAP